jgi:haloalkane dehalogenase
MTEPSDNNLEQHSRAGFEEAYPFKSNFLNVSGHRYHYIDEGAGEVLLFVHGNPSWSFAWRNLVKDLSKNYRVLAVDHIGCGFSDKPQEYNYTLAQHIENLCVFIENLDLSQITLLAHDWGGSIGMGAAGRLPDRFSRFVLMNTAAFRSKAIPKRIAICKIPIFGDIAIRGFNGFAKPAITMAVEKHDRMTPAVKAGYLAPYNNWKNRIATLRFVQDIPLSKKHPSYVALTEVEQGLEQFQSSPMQFIWGEKDWCFTTKFLDEFERRFPQAETLRIPDAGHYVFEDAHEMMLPQIRQFLEKYPL